MTVRTLFIGALALLFSSTSIISQDLDSEIGFQYVKGNYLFDSGRFDEAIQIYNDILKGEPSYEDALIYRARAKYALGAYKGAKKDALKYIEYNGLNEDACLTLGKAELGLGNPFVALSYLDYCIFINTQNSEALLFRGNAYFEIEDVVSACTDWHKAIKQGSDKARQQADRYCQRVAIPIDDIEESKEDVVVNDNDDDTLDEDEVLSTGQMMEEESEEPVATNSSKEEDEGPMKRDEVILIGENGPIGKAEDIGESAKEENKEEEEPEVVVPVEPIDDSVEILEIDEDLDIKVYAGIGNRSVRNTPDILILSDNAGQVVVDVCLDKSGNVISATLNRNDSTIGSAGLISLSLRKAREFKFDRSRKDEQCGKIAFMIK